MSGVLKKIYFDGVSQMNSEEKIEGVMFSIGDPYECTLDIKEITESGTTYQRYRVKSTKSVRNIFHSSDSEEAEVDINLHNITLFMDQLPFRIVKDQKLYILEKPEIFYNRN